MYITLAHISDRKKKVKVKSIKKERKLIQTHLQMVTVIIGVCWEFWKASNNQSSNGHVGGGQGETTSSKEQESKSHVDGQVGSIPENVIVINLMEKDRAYIITQL